MRRFVFDSERIARWVYAKVGGDYMPGDPGIAVERDGELVVGVTYADYTGPSIAMNSRCDDPHATSLKFYWMIFDYPFNQVKVTNLRGAVSSSNTGAQRVNERLGFRREALLADYFPDGDAIIYVMRRADCRWLTLGERYGQEVLRSRACCA